MIRVPIRSHFVLNLVLWVLISTAAWGADRQLTLDTLFSPDPALRVELGGNPIDSLTWAPDSRSFLYNAGDSEIFVPPQRAWLEDGTAAPLFELESMLADLADDLRLPTAEARNLRPEQVTLGPQWRDLVIERAGDLYHYSIADGSARRLTRDEGAAELVTYSPDGRRLSFVRDGGLFALDLASTGLIELAPAEDEETLNGKLDWVYQEEVYGRGEYSAHWWSPDSRRIAYLQLDLSGVPEVMLTDHLAVRQRLESQRYPKAGETNPRARLGVVAATGGDTVWVDTSRWADSEHLVVRVGWTPDSSRIFFVVQDREQTWVDLNLADPETGEVSPVLHEQSPAFVDIGLYGEPLFLADGSFLWRSARTGFHHLYHFSAEGEVLRQLTSGGWELRELHGFDAASGWVYFAGTEHSPIEVHLYRVRLEGTETQRLSRHRGVHQALLSPDFAHYLDRWSDAETPWQVTLHRADGEPLRLIDGNQVEALDRFDLPEIEFFQVPAGDGFALEAAWILPPDFDPRRRYPVLQFNYGGPHAQTVVDRWGGPRFLWLRFLAQEGFIVWMCDNRSASGKGIRPTWEIHGRLGEVELDDIEACLDWLQQKPWVDSSRIGIYGSSYGGFLSAFALAHSQSFKVGIAFAPVTDWRLYDSVYTERYMRRPQDNVEGYSRSSVLQAAEQLSGRLLLIHGAMDDNVHVQNSMQLADALQRAGKEFELMLYPTARHGVRDRHQIRHLYGLMTSFLKEHL